MPRPGKMLGCNLRRLDDEAPLKLSRYIKAELDPAPAKVYWEYKIPSDAWGMFGNDTIGDCTCACIAHMLMMVTAHTGNIVIPEEKDVIGFYSAVSGYDPSTGANDNGAWISDVLDRWRDVGLAGHKIVQWADIDPTNVDHQKLGIYLFGATDDAVNLPNSAMDQTDAGQPWSVIPDDGGIDGGHSIPRFGYGSVGSRCVTWGKLQGGTWEWWQKYLTESTVVITEDWLKNGIAPNGFDMDTLVSDIKLIGY